MRNTWNLVGLGAVLVMGCSPADEQDVGVAAPVVDDLSGRGEKAAEQSPEGENGRQDGPSTGTDAEEVDDVPPSAADHHDQPATDDVLGECDELWDGYVEAYLFEDGSDRVRLCLHEDGSGALFLGDSLIPQPADPETWPIPLASQLLPGIAYPIFDDEDDPHRVRSAIDDKVLARSWCELQTPVLYENGEGQEQYLCSPPGPILHDGDTCWRVTFTSGGDGSGGGGSGGMFGGVGGMPGQGVQVDCGKHMMCTYGGGCLCDAEGCTAAEPTPEDVRLLDVTYDDKRRELSGTLLDLDNLQVRLFKAD